MLWNNPNVKSGVEKVEGAIGKPEDLAAAICFIASDEARFINGTTLVVDGGRLDILLRASALDPDGRLLDTGQVMQLGELTHRDRADEGNRFVGNENPVPVLTARHEDAA